MKSTDKQGSFHFVPAHLAVKAMRDNGYRNTGYAIAELIDNAIQAKAKNVEVFCLEEVKTVVERDRRQIVSIAVLDDGTGMDENTLRMALQFGNGMYLQDRSGIGRFGMGLPSSSISQCKRVEVWTWQGGVKNAIYSYLDVGEIERQELTEVPKPKKKPIPDLWRNVSKAVGKSGTLVVWSNMDRLMWRGAKATLENAEFIVGRMYRNFIHEGKTAIRLVAFMEKELPTLSYEQLARANDPVYVMAPTSTPKPFETKPMFRPWGEKLETAFKIECEKKVYPVTVRISWAREEIRPTDGTDPGGKAYGKHAARNIGVSIVRARRELELDLGWTIGYDPRERWWGVEVEFPAALDEIFGVTNNKQAATNFEEIAKLDWKAFREDGNESLSDVQERLKADKDPRGPLLEIAEFIRNNLSNVRQALKQLAKDSRKGRHDKDGPSIEDIATKTAQQRTAQGHPGESDRGAPMSPDEKKEELQKTFEQKGIPSSAADEMAASAVYRDRKFVLAVAPLDTPAFFSVEIRAQTIIITLNQEHPAYEKLVEVLEGGTDAQGESQIEARLERADDALRLLLCAWARYEDETPSQARDKVKKARADWGAMAREFLSDGDGDE